MRAALGRARGPLASRTRSPAPGDWLELSRVFDASAVHAFAAVTGDENPIHLDDDVARASPFGERIVHGALVASLIPACFSTVFPGAVYRSQTLKFQQSVPVGASVCARIVVVRVRALDRGRMLLRCDTSCELRPSGERAVTGEAEVLV